MYEPNRSVLKGPHPAPAQGHTPINSTNVIDMVDVDDIISAAVNVTRTLFSRAETDSDAGDSSPDSLGVVFR